MRAAVMRVVACLCIVGLCAAKDNLEGEAFLMNNQNKPGVVASMTGLQVKTIKKGTGATCESGYYCTIKISAKKVRRISRMHAHS